MKEIKFSLFVGDNEASDLESLRENFNFNDILTHFKSGKLEKWLKAQGYEQEYEKVANLSKDSLDEDAIITLCQILKSPHSSDENQLKEISQYVRYSKDRQEFFARIKYVKEERKKILNDYHKGFFALIETIIAYKDDIPTIKNRLNTIIKDYNLLFFLHFNHIFGMLSHRAPLAIFLCFCIENLAPLFRPENLTDENWIEYFASKLGIKAEFENDYIKTDYFMFTKQNLNCQNFLKMAYKNMQDFEAILKNNILHIVEAKNCKCREWYKITEQKEILVLQASGGCVLRSVGDINNEPKKQVCTEDGMPIPLLLNGLEVKMSNTSDRVIYLEV
ncbi:hypothetical protein [Helicobacter sp. T3_23-1056]